MNLRSNRGEERRGSKTALIAKGEEEGRGTPTSTPSLKGREAAPGFPVLQQSSGQASPARSGCIQAFWGLPNPLVQCGSRCSRTLPHPKPDMSTCNWSTSNPPALTSHQAPRGLACSCSPCTGPARQMQQEKRLEITADRACQPGPETIHHLIYFPALSLFSSPPSTQLCLRGGEITGPGSSSARI